MAADRLQAIAADVIDGRAPDWASLEADSNPPERALLAELRLIAAVASAHRAAADDGSGQWGPLRVVEEVGRGSFGIVYRAFDPQLAREVALKLMSDTADASEIVEEGRLLARVSHPHVVTVFGADVIDGCAGLWMEFINGRTLQDLLRAQGPFGAHEAAVIGRTLCSALAAVHGAGLVHGDIKAQNVMREHGGRVVLMDFGAGNGKDRRRTTGPESVSGTPVYAAPEVLDGLPPDPRSDIYSLGVLLFHLVTGSYPTRGRTLDEVARAHRSATRVRLRDLRADLPSAFVEAVEAACAADPSRRHRSAGEFETALGAVLQAEAAAPPARTVQAAAPLRRRAGAATALVVILLLTAAAVWTPHRIRPWRAAAATAPAPRVKSIAVLAIEDLDLDDPGFARGLTTALSLALAHLQGIKVVAGQSSVGLKTSGKPAAQIARDLGVEAVLDATVNRREGQVILSARLIDGGSGQDFWHERFTRSVQEVPLLQDALARSVADSLQAPLTGPAAPPRVAPAAYDAYLHARGLWNTRNHDAMLEARTLYERAIALDPAFAAAYAGLANCYTLLSVYGILPKQDAAPKAKAAARKALELDPESSEAYTALAYSRIEEWDWPGGEQAYRRAIELNPNDALAHHWYGLTIAERKPEEAVAEIERAAELDPLSRAIDIDVGMVYLRAGRVDDAIAHLKTVLTIYPEAHDARLTLGEAYFRRNQPAEAAAEFERVLSADPTSGAAMSWLGACYQQLGRTRDAQALLARAHAVARTTYLRPSVFATLAIAAGDLDQALQWIEKGVDLREDWASGIGTYPWMAPLRGNPRFAMLVKRVERERRY